MNGTSPCSQDGRFARQDPLSDSRPTGRFLAQPTKGAEGLAGRSAGGAPALPGRAGGAGDANPAKGADGFSRSPFAPATGAGPAERPGTTAVLNSSTLSARRAKTS